MTIAERIKELRKDHLHLNQEDFAEKIFMKRNSITQIEIGTRKASERTIKTICDVYRVNMDWLCNGQGPIFKELTREEEITKYMADLVSSNDEDKEFQKKFIRILSQLDTEQWKLIEKMAENLAKEKD